MNTRWKSSLRWLAIRLGTGAALVAGCYVLLGVVARGHCDRSETLLANGPHGDVLLDRFEACTSLGTDMDERVVLKLPSGKSLTLFHFAPNGGITGVPGPDGRMRPVPRAELAASWTTPQSIRISIGAVAGISEQLSRVQGYEVSYDIGMNIDTYRSLHP